MIGIHDGSFGYGGGQRSYSFGKGGSFRKELDTNVIQLDDLTSEQFFIRNSPLSADYAYYRFGADGGDMTLAPGDYSPYLPLKHTGLLWVRSDSTATLEIFIVR